MFKNRFYMFALLLLLFTMGCSVSIDEDTTQNPSAYPSFVLNIEFRDYETLRFDESMCLELNQEPFWISNEQDFEHTERLIENIFITIDDELVELITIEQTASTFIRYVHDSDGQSVGWYADPITICFEISHLTRGTHTISVEFTTISGLHNQYTWNFLID
ncbi:MAG: hypothetical protein AAFQ07_07155 [Chloroflexota bacterium]